jgi:hypothetical protein
MGAVAVESVVFWRPFGIDRVELHGGAAPPDTEVWAHATAGLAGDGALIRGDVQLLAPSGALLATLSGVSMRRVSQAALRKPPPWRQWIYELNWRRLDPVPSPATGEAAGAAEQSFAVVLDRLGYGERFARELEARGVAVARCAGPQEFYRDKTRDATHIVSFSALDGGAPEEVTGRALALLQTASGLPWRRAPRIWWITAGAQAVAGQGRPLSVAQASLWGLARCAALELSESWGGLVDLDPQAGAGGAAALSDVLAGKDDQLAVRSGAVFAARLEPRPVSLPQRSRGGASSARRGDATYLISGGLGGVGWACSAARRPRPSSSASSASTPGAASRSGCSTSM